ncbi:FecR family protein [Psychrosphaera sp. F3M07]|uniref:FecR family protein n=1 Tax=Psychrosphaera sp. F3M07 TaxID=2841560 RepID=UPI001C0A3107|nr:FecR family protein [Psychrosphaera sp. F3M07]MBU2917193.1 FecR family protein [Psychrosphaera sp. F3M07]
MKIKIRNIMALFTLTMAISAQATTKETVATVLAKKGDVSIISADNIVAAKRKSTLAELDKIATAKDAKASVKFNDGTITTLGSNSEMLIKGYKWSEDDKTPSAEFELVKGVFRTVTGLVTKVSNPSFTVKTPMGSIGIRGTDFWGGYLEEDAVDVLFVGGEHEIVVSNEFGTTVLTTPGQGTTIKAGQAPTAAKVWPQKKVDRAVKTITF